MAFKNLFQLGIWAYVMHKFLIEKFPWKSIVINFTTQYLLQLSISLLNVVNKVNFKSGPKTKYLCKYHY